MSREAITLTDTERAALDALVPPDQQTGVLREDLVAAVAETLRRRRENSRLGAAVINALHRDSRSWRTVQYLTGIGRMAAANWGAKAPGIDP